MHTRQFQMLSSSSMLVPLLSKAGNALGDGCITVPCICAQAHYLLQLTWLWLAGPRGETFYRPPMQHSAPRPPPRVSPPAVAAPAKPSKVTASCPCHIFQFEAGSVSDKAHVCTALPKQYPLTFQGCTASCHQDRQNRLTKSVFSGM